MKKVEIYTTPTCVYCKMAKAFFKEHNVPFTEHNVAEDEKAREEMIDKSGQLGVPVISIGEDVIVGYNEKTLKELLELK
jgi:glutaredoxin-like YruB-family protein